MLAILKPRRLSSALVLGVVVCGIIALVLQGLAQSRYEALDRARADLAMARQAAVGGTERLLQPYRLSLEAVANGIDVLERHEADPGIRQILLFDSSTHAPFFSAILVLDVDGRVRRTVEQENLPDARIGLVPLENVDAVGHRLER